jgi:hypothetical protein
MNQSDNTIDKYLGEFFAKDENRLWNIFNKLFLYISSRNFDKTDIYYLGEILSYDQLKKIAEYYDGDKIRTPKKNELENCYILTVCFFLYKILGWDWPTIKNYFKESSQLNLNTKSYGTQIKKLEEKLSKDMHVALDSVEKNTELHNFLKEVKQNV